MISIDSQVSRHAYRTGKENPIRKLLVFLLSALPAICYAKAPQIRNGAAVYIEPMDGYEIYLATAFTKKHVPLIVVANRDKAEYVITSTAAHRDLSALQPGQQQLVVDLAARRALAESSASIAVIDLQASQIVYAYAAGKMGTNQPERTAEDCAEHLKKSIAKPKN